MVGEIEPGLWSACCQNGLGTAKGTLAGVLAAEAANGIGSEVLTRAREATAPRKLPPALITQAGATARLRWGEYRAGRAL